MTGRSPHPLLPGLSWLILLATLIVGESQANALRDHPSPYLALHGEDPVEWQEWSQGILEQAQRSDKPIFISSGYFACHWCHVMQRESFSSPAIAELLNRHFIPVKIDREMLPAMDDYLMAFVRENFGAAGWPLNTFLTPQGYPLTGLSYAKPERFKEILTKIRDGWQRDGENLAYNARLHAMSQLLSPPKPPARIAPQSLKRGLIKQALALANQLQGGIGDGSRFPMAPQYQALLRVLDGKGDEQEELRGWLRLTLDNTAALGMYDHINGGFFRYTIDPDQRTPHFEKMLYNQALQASLYLTAAEQLKEPGYRDVAWASLDFALREMAHPDGGFISAISAIDQQHREGHGYLWREEELASLLSEAEMNRAAQRWSLRGPTPFAAGWLPLPIGEDRKSPFPQGRGGEELDQRITSKLRQAARAKAHPRDSKRIAAWNGLMLSALSQALTTLPPDSPRQQRYHKAGAALTQFLTQQVWQGGQLHRAITDRGPSGSGELNDYAFVAKGLDDWGKVNGDTSPLLGRLLSKAWQDHYTSSGWQPSPDTSLPGMGGKPLIEASPLPSASATLIELTLERGTSQQRALARDARQRASAVATRQPFWHPDHTRLLIQQGQES
jgi:uncharacterized protein YyaL (SSP411 family)